MNKAFRLIYSKARQTWMVANEACHSRARSAVSCAVLAVAAAMAMTAPAHATTPMASELWENGQFVNQDITVDSTNSTTEQNPLKSFSMEGGKLTFTGSVAVAANAPGSTGFFNLKGTQVNFTKGYVNANWVTLSNVTLNMSNSDATDDAKTQGANLGAYSQFVIDGSTITLGKKVFLWTGRVSGSSIYQDFLIQNSTITLNGAADPTKAQEGDTSPNYSYIPKTSNRAVIMGSFYKNNETVDSSITDPKKLGNSLVLNNSTIDVKGYGGINFLYADIASNSTINVATTGDLIVSSYSGWQQGTERMTGSKFTLHGKVVNEGKFRSEVDQFIIDGGVFDNSKGHFYSPKAEANGGLVIIQNGGQFITDADLGKDTEGYTFNPAQGIQLNQGGTLVFTALNSNEAASLEQSGSGVDTTTKNQALVQYPLILNGGQFLYQGAQVDKVKLGTNNSTGTLTVNAGNYKWSNLNFSTNKESKLTMNGGSLELKKLNLKSAAGYVYMNGGTLKVTESVEGNNTVKDFVFGGGTFSSSGSILFKNYETDQFKTASDVWNTHFEVSGGGYVDVYDVTGDYTINDLKTAQNTLDKTNKVQVTFSNGHLKVDGPVSSTDVDGVAVVGQEVQVSNGSASFTNNTTVGSLNFSGGTAGEGSITADKGLTLTGSTANGQIFGSDMTSVNVSGTLTVGLNTQAQDTTINASTLTADTLNVKGSVVGQTVKVTSGGAISDNASLSVQTIDGGSSSGLSVAGTLVAQNVSGTVKVASGGTAVLAAGSGESFTGVTGTLSSNSADKLGRQARDLSSQTTNAQEDGLNSLITTNANATQVMAASTQGLEGYKGRDVLFVDNTLKVGSSGQINVGSSSGSGGVVTLGSTGTLVIDGSKLSATQALIDGSVNASGSGAQAQLINVTKTGTFLLSSGTWTGTVENITTDNLFITASAPQPTIKATGQAIVLSLNTKAVGDEALASAMQSAFQNEKNGQVFLAVGQSSAYIDAQTNTLNATGVATLNEYLSAPVVAGTYNAAYDATNALSQTLVNHAADTAQRAGIWANVLYSANSAKTLYGSSGYSSDVFGGVVGVEGTMPCGAHLGLALSMGTSDAQSENSLVGLKNDANFMGLSLYASHALAQDQFRFTVDLSYLWLDNDLSGQVANASANESLDSNVFTVGLRTDYVAYQGTLDVTPHMGLRYYNVQVDDYRGMASEGANLVEMPVGLQISKTLGNATGWTFTPRFDFTFVPQLGDTSVHTLMGDTRINASLCQTTLGVSGSVGAWTGSLDYGYGFGSGERANNSVQASVRYNF